MVTQEQTLTRTSRVKTEHKISAIILAFIAVVIFLVQVLFLVHH